MAKYSVLKLNFDPKVVTIERLAGVPYDYKLVEAKKLAGQDYPTGLAFSVPNDAGDMVTDIINNILGVLMVSTTVKEFLEQEGLDDKVVQYLPFQIKNKKEKVLDEMFYIVNTLESYNCLDLEKSEYRKDRTTGAPKKIFNLVVEEENVPETTLLFRLGEVKRHIILLDDLVQKINDAGFTGLCVCPCGEKLR